MLVINIFGGPGVGKSTLAAEVFAHFKKNKLNVELVTEYAKDLVWEERNNILKDQLYILAKQNRRLERLRNKGIDVVVTDSPLLLGKIYFDLYNFNDINNISKKDSLLRELIIETFLSYNNMNVLLSRNKDFEYQTTGRVQKNVEEAILLDKRIRKEVKEVCSENSIVEFEAGSDTLYATIPEMIYGQLTSSFRTRLDTSLSL